MKYTEREPRYDIEYRHGKHILKIPAHSNSSGDIGWPLHDGRIVKNRTTVMTYLKKMGVK